MGNINLLDYETVSERLSRFKKDNPNYRMASELLDVSGNLNSSRWIVKVKLWKDSRDEHPVSEGLAFEIDGHGMTQGAAALETCETSALGRALANAGYHGSRKVTRDEMLKVKNAEILDEINRATTEQDLMRIYSMLKRDGIEQYFVGALTERKNAISSPNPQSEHTEAPPTDDKPKDSKKLTRRVVKNPQPITETAESDRSTAEQARDDAEVVNGDA